MASYLFNPLLTVLVLSISLPYSAASPTYASCLEEANSVVINDWCFALLMDGIPYADFFAAEQVCRPNGHVAALMTRQIQTTLQAMVNKAKLNITNLHSVWIAMMQKFNSTTMYENWFWKIRNSDNEYVQMPMIPNELKWASSDPSEFDYVERGNENYGIMVANYGVGDVALNGEGNTMNRGVICQFKAPSRPFVPYSVAGIFNRPGYMINQVTAPQRLQCSVLCSVNEFCQSFAYAASTLDCQLYAVTPLDSAKTAQVVANPSYVMYTRTATVLS